jgi:acetyl-CoA acetyltransferase
VPARSVACFSRLSRFFSFCFGAGRLHARSRTRASIRQDARFAYATKWNISREDQDRLAVESHNPAARATACDLDVIEANEAFAAHACAVFKDLQLDPAKVNPNGSGISLSHLIGATGALITVKALHKLHRIGGRNALVTMCIGGGQGIAAIFERG